MTEVVESVQRVSDIMDEIAAASTEQSNGISQVNEAVTQMDQVTQQNAELVQQAASAATQLEAESGRLREATQRFRLREDAGTARASAAGADEEHETNDLARWMPALMPAGREQDAKGANASSKTRDTGRDEEWESF
ncbi:methyl-accepting chemotaxis protein III [Halomonas elongata]|uniref:Methyl-accepting chemotaxis protein III n=2 Tax=Halomonas elongata TaxID=2746 RepID=A0A1B8NZM8_HALEL|nr:methyl-accepting chemotaxis protein III [Halomonas elongata]